MARLQKGAGRHITQCSVCQHADKDEIERRWRAGRSSRSLGEQYGLHKTAVANHAKYLDLERNLDDILLAIIEAGIDALHHRAPTAAHVNEAIKSLAKLQGRWVDRSEMLPPGWADRSDDEIKFYAEHGRFPQAGELESEETVQ